MTTIISLPLFLTTPTRTMVILVSLEVCIVHDTVNVISSDL